MKSILSSLLTVLLTFSLSACSSRQMTSVLDNISRDTYDKHLKKQHIQNINDGNYERLPTYDQYQQDREELSSER